MGHRLSMSPSFEKVLVNLAPEVLAEYKVKNCDSYTDVIENMISRLNNNYKFEINTYDFNENPTVYGNSSTYFGLIFDENDNEIAYIYFVPPTLGTRSGFLAQQLFPVMSTITNEILESKEYGISNRPVYVLNINTDNMTKAMAVNVISAEILNFNYIDFFDRDISKILNGTSTAYKIGNLIDYDDVVIKNSSTQRNEYFEVDLVNNTLIILNTRINNQTLTNQPYWFSIKAYPAVYLAVKEKMEIDTSQLLSITNNRSITTFFDFVEKHRK